MSDPTNHVYLTYFVCMYVFLHMVDNFCLFLPILCIPVYLTIVHQMALLLIASKYCFYKIVSNV